MESRKQWISFFKDVGLHEQVLHCTRAALEDGDEAEHAFLPFTGVATAGMLLLLARCLEGGG